MSASASSRARLSRTGAARSTTWRRSDPMDVLAVVLSPIIAVMGFILGIYAGVTGSPGLAVILLSATMSLILFPIQRIALRAERAHSEKSGLIQAEVQEAKKSGLKGEALFDATEAIYKRYSYHPIHAL